MHKSYEQRKSFAQGLHGCNETIYEHCLWWWFQGKGIGLGKVAITNDMSHANVMLVQSLQYNLLSVRQLASVGYDTLFGLTSVKVFRRDTLEVAFVGELDGNLYTVDFSKESTYHASCLLAKDDKGWLWHRQLAHVGMRNLKDLLKG